MLSGVTGARASAVQSERRVIDIRSSQIREMEGKAELHGLNFGPTMRGRMSLEQAFAALRAGQIDLNDDASPIRFPRPTEIGNAMDRHPEIWGHTLLTLDDGINQVVIDLDHPGEAGGSHHVEVEEQRYARHSGQHSHDEDVMVDLEPRQPRVYIREVEPGEGHEVDHGGYDAEPMPRLREEPMDAPRTRHAEERGPMPRGGHPTYDRREPPMGFDRAPQSAEDAPRVRKVDSRGGAQAQAPQGFGEDGHKIGRVTLDRKDWDELFAIAKDLKIPGSVLFRSLRAPTNDERVFARGKEKFMLRDAEIRERIITIDVGGKMPPVVVSFAPKPSFTNLWSAALHGVSLIPGIGPGVQAALGAATAITGFVATMGAKLFGLGKHEHHLNLMRTGIKHTGWGIVNGLVDFKSAGALWGPRALVSAAAMGLDIAQWAQSRKRGSEAGYIVAEKPTAIHRATGALDTMANGIATALKK